MQFSHALKASLVKATMMAVTPYFDPAAPFLTEAINWLLKASEPKPLLRMDRPLPKSLLQAVSDFSTAEGINEERIEAILDQTSEALTRHAVDAVEWARLGYDPDATTAFVMKRIDENYATSDLLNRDLMKLVYHNFYAGLADDPNIVAATEIAFRRILLEKVADLTALSTPVSLLPATIAIPRYCWSQELAPAAALLRPDQVFAVPFHEREADLSDLLNWREKRDRFRLRLITGPGGRGKTRLAIETCKVAVREGWIAGFILTDDRKMISEAFREIDGKRTKGVLAVIDYAETRIDTVTALAGALSRNDAYKSRVLLLARSRGDWWLDLQSRSGEVGNILRHEYTERIRLNPVVSEPSARAQSWRMALQRFRKALAKTPDEVTEPDLSADFFDEVLYVHSSALLHLDGDPKTDRIGILDQMVHRERRFWLENLKRRQMNQNLVKPILQAVTAIKLIDGVKHRERALDLLRALPIMKGQTELEVDSLSQILHELYPGQLWIEPLMPDLIGEHLIGLTAREQPELLEAVADHAR